MRCVVAMGALLLCLLGAAIAVGATGVDPGFGRRGVVLTGFGSHVDVRDHSAKEITVEPSGKVVLGITGPRGIFTVERLTATGAPDRGFGDAGVVTAAINGQAMAVTPVGGVVVVGSQGEDNPGRDIAVTKYGPDGQVDRSFGHHGTYRLDAGLEDFGEAVALQPDGTIVVAGRSQCPGRTRHCPYETSSRLVLLRLSPDGRLLSRTDRRLSSTDPVGMAVAADGRILVATAAAGRYRPPLLIAFDRTGKLATSFGHKGSVQVVPSPAAPTLTLAADGDPLYASNPYSPDTRVHRLLPDGSPDGSFGKDGAVACKPTRNQYGEANWTGFAPESDGKLLIAGGNGDCALARYLPDGSLDPSFGEGGRVEASVALGGRVEGVAAGPRESALVLRWQVGVGFRLARFLADGSVDRSFGRGGLATVKVKARTFDQVNALLPLHKGRLLAVGSSQCGDWSCGEFALARYLPDGSLDRSFGRRGLVTTPFAGEAVATSAAIQPDRDIVVAGTVGVRAAGELHETRPTLARYRPGGDIDNGFGEGGIVTLPARKGEDVRFNGVAIAPGGDIVAVGEADCRREKRCGPRYCAECSDFFVARFGPHGALDRAFGQRGVLRIRFPRSHEYNDAARAVAIRPDGRIVIAGHAWQGGFALVRLLPDGRRDPSFGHHGIVNTYFAITLHGEGGKPFDLGVPRRGYALRLLADGRILVAGGLVAPNQAQAHPANHGVVARYLADGRLDPSFGDGGITEIDGLAIRALTVDRCGQTVVAGAASKDRSPTGFGAARLLPSGAIDHRFGAPSVQLHLGTGTESRANAIALSGDRVVLGGVASNDGAGDEFALAALRSGPGCSR
jgi:uncharacterized delta-60 repeat protein